MRPFIWATFVIATILFSAFAISYNVAANNYNNVQDVRRNISITSLLQMDASLLQQFNNTNKTLALVNSTLHTILATMITNITTLAQQRIATINGIQGVPSTGDITLNAIGPGLNMVGLQLNTTAVLTIEGQANVTDLVGNCTLNVTAGPMAHQVTLDLCTLSTAVNVLDMTDASQTQNISALSTGLSTVQQLIDSVANATYQLDDLFNETSQLNTTLLEYVSQLIVLQSVVADLQAIIANRSLAKVQTGTLVPFGGLMAPTGYLLCDGATVSRTTYANLFAVVGTTWCTPGPCSNTTFQLPNLRGRVPMASGNGATTGTTMGATTTTLTSMPAHTHSISTQPNHQHDVVLANGTRWNQGNPEDGCFGAVTRMEPLAGMGGFSIQFDSTQGEPIPGPSSTNPICQLGVNSNHVYFTSTPPSSPFYPFGTGAENNGGHNHGGNTGSIGTGQSIPVVQPTVVVGGYMIKI